MIRARGLAFVGACFALLAAYPGGGAASVSAAAASKPAPATRAAAVARTLAATPHVAAPAPVTAFEATAAAATSPHSGRRAMDPQRRNSPLDVTPAVTG